MPELIIAPEVLKWMQDKIGWELPNPYVVFGIVFKGRIVGGVSYHNYTGSQCEVSAITTSIRWAAKDIIKQLLSYPFNEMGCRRITALTDSKNTKARRMLERMGFKQEGVIREGSLSEAGTDAIYYGLLKREFEEKW